LDQYPEYFHESGNFLKDAGTEVRRTGISEREALEKYPGPTSESAATR
jgi:hypothetical protein